MPQGRPPIPRALERELLIEAGYRCAIPSCRVMAPLVIDHIEDWAKVREHTFDNMIVLCANHHGIKGEKPRQLSRKVLRQYKANLSLLNHRYGELERRLLEDFGQRPSQTVRFLPGGMEIFVRSLINDGYLDRLDDLRLHTTTLEDLDDEGFVNYMEPYMLTEAGQEFVRNWLDAKPLPL